MRAVTEIIRATIEVMAATSRGLSVVSISKGDSGGSKHNCSSGIGLLHLQVRGWVFYVAESERNREMLQRRSQSLVQRVGESCGV